MRKEKIYLYSIMPLDVEYIEELCEDIRNQYETGVATCALFAMVLMPEGNPPVNRAEQLCAKYRLFKEKLDKMKIPSGVLIQTSIGHDRKLSNIFPYQRYIAVSDGSERYVVCPSDKNFQEYMYHAARLLASCEPECIMVDDDYRMIARPGRGCACPLHLRRFNELAGTSWSREELTAYMYSDEQYKPEYTEAFIETQKESLVECAKAIRAGIDSVNPAIQGAYCCVDQEMQFAPEIAGVLAGKGNPTIVRVGNGYYTAKSAREIVNCFYRAATQTAKLRDKVDVLLAETDTIPHNRYSLGAMSLHSHFTGTILEGVQGAKQWITNLLVFDPDCGKAYRRILSKYRGFYEALVDMVPTLRWRGCRIPVSSASKLTTGHDWGYQIDKNCGWSNCVLDRLGLPMYFGADNGGVLFLEGDADKVLTDEELRAAFRGTVVTASNTARNLIDRGFGELLGVEVREWNGKSPGFEVLDVNGGPVRCQVQMQELVPICDGVREDSTACCSLSGGKRERLFAGTTVFKNNMGGTAIVFSGTPQAKFTYAEAFSFLNGFRKKQLIRLLSQAGELPVYYPNDEEVYMRVADMKDGGYFCSLLNIGFDPIEKLELVCCDKIAKIEKLMPDGRKEELTFACTEDRYVIETSCITLEPLVLLMFQ